MLPPLALTDSLVGGSHRPSMHAPGRSPKYPHLLYARRPTEASVKPSEINRPVSHRAASPSPPPEPEPPSDEDLVATWEEWAAQPWHPLRDDARKILAASGLRESPGGPPATPSGSATGRDVEPPQDRAAELQGRMGAHGAPSAPRAAAGE